MWGMAGYGRLQSFIAPYTCWIFFFLMVTWMELKASKNSSLWVPFGKGSHPKFEEVYHEAHSKYPYIMKKLGYQEPKMVNAYRLKKESESTDEVTVVG